MAVSLYADASIVTRVVPVDDASHVGEVRRAAMLVADRAALGETGRGRAALVATELATNLARHARGGAVLLRALAEDGGGVELLAVDRGPGLDVARCLEDGFSTAGSAGEGLGAIRRLSRLFDIHSERDRGTIVLARVGEGDPASRGGDESIATGVVCTPAPGEERSGDGWAVDRRPGRLRLLVVDGLGHGPLAAEASAEAARLFLAHPEPGPGEMLERIHDGLRATRGAAAAVAEIVPGASAVRFAGIGNIAASVHGVEGVRSLVSHNGIVGHQVRRVQEMTCPWVAEARLVVTSDGVRSQWRLEEHPGLASRHPAIVAALLHRDHLRGRDDATVLVAGGTAFPAR